MEQQGKKQTFGYDMSCKIAQFDLLRSRFKTVMMFKNISLHDDLRHTVDINFLGRFPYAFQNAQVFIKVQNFKPIIAEIQIEHT